MTGALRALALLLCATAVALSLPLRPAVERECVNANAKPRAAACLVSDLDGDTKADYAFSLDFAARSLRPASISIHLSSIPESYRLILPEGLAPSSFVFRDVDGDGRLDIALLGGFNEVVGVFLNNGSGRFRFDGQDHYLTSPSHDLSAMAAPRCPRSYECAEAGFGGGCAASCSSVIEHRPPNAPAGNAASLVNSRLRFLDATRSRAP